MGESPTIIYKGYNTHTHGYHSVEPSLFPFLIGLYALCLTLSGVAYMHYFVNGFSMLLSNIATTGILMAAWWAEIITEATYEGHHTWIVQRGLRYGVILFIVSEIMFFFGFFWAFFHSSLSPAVTIGGIWPPEYIEVFSPWGLPLLNTLILLASGASVTWAHYAICEGSWPVPVWVSLYRFLSKFRTIIIESAVIIDRILPYSLTAQEYLDTLRFYVMEWNIKQIILISSSIVSGTLGWIFVSVAEILYISIYSLAKAKVFQHKDMIRTSTFALFVTVSLGTASLYLQGIEYIEAPFSISDGIYGSTSYSLTGFHGFHVLTGTIFLFVCLVRNVRCHFTRQHHLGFEAAAWHWHPVDVVWLFSFVVVYWWGGL